LPNSLIVEILGNGKEFAASMDEAGANTAKFGKAAKIAGTALLGGLAYGLDKSVEAAVKAQTSTARMDQAFKQSGLSAKTFAGQIDHAEQSARNLGFANSDVRESLGSLVIATKSGKESFKDLGIAEDLARFKHIGLTDSTKMLTTAMAGSTKAVHALGLNIIPVTSAVDRVNQEFKVHTGRAYEAAKATAELADKQATAKEIIAAVTDKVHGQAQAFAETAAGKMQTFKAQLESIGESIGQVVLPALESFASVLAKVAGWLAQHQTVAKILVAGLAALGVTLVAIIPLVTAFGTALAFVAANPIVLLVAGIALLAGAIAAAVLAPQKFEAALEKMGVSAGTAKAIVTDLQGVFTDFKAVVEALLPTIEAIFDGIVDEIKGAFTVIKGIFDVIDGLLHGNWSQVWTGLKDIVSGSLQAIEGLLRAASAVLVSLMKAVGDALLSAVKGPWNDIKNLFDDGIKFVKSHWKDFVVALAAIATGPLGALVALIATHWRTIRNDATSAWDAIKGAVAGAWHDIEHAVESGVNTVVSFVRTLPGKLKAAVGNLGNLLVSAGISLIKGLESGIISEAKHLFDVVSGIAGKIAGLFPHSPAKEGPLSVPINWESYLSAGISQAGKAVNSSLSGVLQTPTIGAANGVPVAGGGAAVGASAGGVTYNFSFPNYVGSKQELTNMIQQQLLRLQLRGGQVLLPG